MKIYDKKLAYPYFVWMVLFTVVPLFIVVYYAMTDAEGNFTLNNLTSISGYGSVFARSLLLALIATVICLVIAFPVGYFLSRLRVNKLIRDVDAENGARVPTGVLNEMLARATARMQPPSDKGRRLKIYYLTQASTRPPTFVAFVNAKHLFHFSYQRYLINQIRENFGLEHTPCPRRW